MLILFLGVATSLPAAELFRLEQSLDAMGSVYTVVSYGEDRAKMIAAVDQAFEEVRRLDRMLSNYRPDSELSRINREAASHPVTASEEMFRLLEACRDYSQSSDGAFDISVGPLMKIWGFYKGTGRLPHRAEVRGVLSRVGYQKVELDPKDRSVRFARTGMELDPGGIGKGYAVDRMVEILRGEGITSALISAGASSIYAIGAPPKETGWAISIRHPRDVRKAVDEVKLNNQSMSTSGTSEKFFRAEGRLYSHIMDPRTGFPAQGTLSVSVIAPRTLDSEAWTKPVFINGRRWAEKNRPKQFRVFLCEDKGGSEQAACAWLQ